MKTPRYLLAVLLVASSLFSLGHNLGPVNAQVTGDSQVVAPTIIDSLAVPGTKVSLLFNILSVGPDPEDLDAWQMAGSVDSSHLRLDPAQTDPDTGLPVEINSAFPSRCQAIFGTYLPTVNIDPVAGTFFVNSACLTTRLDNPPTFRTGLQGDFVPALTLTATVLTRDFCPASSSKVDLSEADTLLRDTSGTTITGIPATITDGLFENCKVNNPPTASFTASPLSGDTPLLVSFDGSASSDPDAGDAVVSWKWTFGDGTSETTMVATTSHTYTCDAVGGSCQYTASLVVNDGALDSTNTATAMITVNGPAPFDYSLSVSPSSATVKQGSSNVDVADVTVTLTSGTAQAVDLSATVTPPAGGSAADVTVSFNPDPITLALAPGAKSALLVTVSSMAKEGVYSIEIRGSPSGLTPADEVALLTLTVSTIVHDVAVGDITASPLIVLRPPDVDVTITVVVTNMGTETETFSVTAFVGAMALPSQTVSNLAAGMSHTLTFTVNTSVLADGSSLIKAEAVLAGDANPANNSKDDGTLDVRTKVHDLAVTAVTPSATSANVGDILTVRVTVTNQGDFDESAVVHAYYDSNPIGELSGMVAAGASMNFDFAWNTAGVARGTYTISGHVVPVAGETDTPDNTFIDGTVFVMVHDIAVVSISPELVEVDHGNVVRVDVGLKNNGNVDESGVVVKVFADGQQIGEALASIPAGASTIVSINWNTVGFGGFYGLEAEAALASGLTDANPQDNVLVFEGTVFIRVHDVAVLVITVTPSDALVEVGTVVTVNVRVQNNGNVAEAGVVVDVFVDGTRLQRFTIFSISPGAFTDVPVSWNTEGFELVEYTVEARASLPAGKTDNTPSDNVLIDGTVTLVPAKGSVRVEVVDSTLSPVAGATVVVSSQGGETVFTGSTDSDGLLTVELSPGSYVVKVSKEGLLEFSIVATVEAGGTTTLRVPLQEIPRAPSAPLNPWVVVPVSVGAIVFIGFLVWLLRRPRTAPRRA